MEALVRILVDTLNSMSREEFGLLCGVATNMQRLSDSLSTAEAVLEDAEQKQFTYKAIQKWLQKLNAVAYEIEDVLDDYRTEASRVRYKNSGCFWLICYPVIGNLVFRHKIGTRMKEILKKFNAIDSERRQLGLSDQKHGSYFSPSRETASLVNEPEVLGRDEEKEQIVHTLMEEKIGHQNVSVLPIVGLGGLGKTTLAQWVFNDERIAKHFEPKLWVWVSEDFDVKGIIKALINSIEGTSAEPLELDPVQRKLQELLRGKRYLVVLDDVWNDNQEEWEKLKSVLACGSRGSSIVVTTRMRQVSEIMGTLQTHYLSSLSDDQCWSLFRQRAFGRQEAEEYPNLIAIGKEIVKKCGGLPLAAKALGGFLRFKREETEWNFVKCSEIWNLPQDTAQILPALKLSYLNLPAELRGCFAYCAVFPKGYEIEKEEVIHGWMANGLISPKGTMAVEDVGDAVLNELHYRSLLQSEERGKFGRVRTVYKMHDLVYDLAQSIMEGKHNGTESDTITRHLTLNLQDDQLIVAFPIRREGGTEQYSSFLSIRGSLREFIARQTWMGKKFIALSPAISNLKHLRHLNLSGSDIVELPNSICDLWNLQILNLNDCVKLRSLPKGMRFLRNLRHLCLEKCWELTHMPSGIGKLTCLRTLSMVVPSDKKGFQLSELRDLNNLRGTLRIRHLERIEDKKDVEEANLIAKQSLLKLYLGWNLERRSQPNNDEEVANALKPFQESTTAATRSQPNKLQFLKIEGFKGSSFPVWISTLKNVVEIELGECHNSTRLPVLSHLPHLQRLKVYGSEAEYIVDDDDDDEDKEQTVHGAQEECTTTAAWFPSLKGLSLVDMPNLKGMLRREVGGTTSTSTREVFPRLQFLWCINCPKLTSPLPRMLSLIELYVSECPSNMAWASISDLTNLKSLRISGIEGLSCFPEEMLQNLTLLENLDICRIMDLQALPSRSLASLTALKSLAIRDCPELMKSLSEEGLQGLESLTSLVIQESYATALPEVLKDIPTLQNLDLWNYPNLTSLPDWFGQDHLASLQRLTLRNCPKLETLPSSIQMMTTLQSLTIIACERLEPRCEMGGAEWHKIKHIRHSSIIQSKHTMTKH